MSFRSPCWALLVYSTPLAVLEKALGDISSDVLHLNTIAMSTNYIIIGSSRAEIWA